MTLAAADLEELSRSIADRLYVQVAGWHLYLGDAGLAQRSEEHTSELQSR